MEQSCPCVLAPKYFQRDRLTLFYAPHPNTNQHRLQKKCILLIVKQVLKLLN